MGKVTWHGERGLGSLWHVLDVVQKSFFCLVTFV